jgi:SanA protein
LKPRLRRFLRRWFWGGLITVLVLGLLCNRWVINSTDAYVYRDMGLLPANQVGLVLGTSSYARSGEPSLEFEGRIHAAAQLYLAGKVKHLIVSGANPDASYNEPRRMRRALVERGVPASAITMDFAGFRTLDSIVRAQAVWGLSGFTVITQRYHAYRAVFLARKAGLTGVVAFAAPVSTGPDLGSRHPVREVFARIKAVIDILLLDTQPRHLGEAQEIQLRGDAEDV